MRIQLTFAETSDPLEELLGGRIALTEVIEGRQEFLEELMRRLHAITHELDRLHEHLNARAKRRSASS